MSLFDNAACLRPLSGLVWVNPDSALLVGVHAITQGLVTLLLSRRYVTSFTSMTYVDYVFAEGHE